MLPKKGGVFVYFGALACLLPNQSLLPRKPCLGARWLRLSPPTQLFSTLGLKGAVFTGGRGSSQQKLRGAKGLLETEELRTN